MSTALQISGLVLVALLIILVVTVTVLFSKALQEVLVHADKARDRSADQVDKLLDRLMAIDFATYKAYQLTETTPDGSFLAPDEQEHDSLWGTEAPTRIYRHDEELP